MISSLHPSSNLTVRKGSTVKLSCNASGFPIPGISWQREVRTKYLRLCVLPKITKSIALASSPTKEQKDPKTMSDGTEVRKSGELSLLQWTYIDDLKKARAKKNLRDFSYVIWNLWKNDTIFLEWENLGRRPTVNECTRPLSQRNPELFITFLLHNDQDTPSYSKVWQMPKKERSFQVSSLAINFDDKDTVVKRKMAIWSQG